MGRERRPPGCGDLFLVALFGWMFVVWVWLMEPDTSEAETGPSVEVLPTGATLTGCDMDLANDPASMAQAALSTINLWERYDYNGRVVGSARGTDPTATRGSPAWCVGEPVSVLERRLDPQGRERVRVRTTSGDEGWVTAFFLLE